ncbi:hypothetical protein STEG23_013334, partial [Scotinomys teguina]
PMTWCLFSYSAEIPCDGITLGPEGGGHTSLDLRVNTHANPRCGSQFNMNMENEKNLYESAVGGEGHYHGDD